VAELVAGSLQLMVGHMVGTRVVPQAHNRQVMHWALVEQESPVPAVVVAATGAATAVHNMVVVAAVLAGPTATWFLCVTRRAFAMETVN
jgi:GDP-D-mannose dehydratase